MKINNAVTHRGKTYTRTGKSYSHAVVMTSKASKTPLVEWASSRELAEKNLQAHLGRVDRAARGVLGGGVFSLDYYHQFVEAVIVDVEHPDVLPVSAKAAGRTANRVVEADDDTDDTDAVKDIPVEAPAVVVVKDEDAAKRARWAANKRASRARLKKSA